VAISASTRFAVAPVGQVIDGEASNSYSAERPECHESAVACAAQMLSGPSMRRSAASLTDLEQGAGLSA